MTRSVLESFVGVVPAVVVEVDVVEKKDVDVDVVDVDLDVDVAAKDLPTAENSALA